MLGQTITDQALTGFRLALSDGYVLVLVSQPLESPKRPAEDAEACCCGQLLPTQVQTVHRAERATETTKRVSLTVYILATQ